eukprot:m.62701 g.62701  ORF g.62701 m.62701 type:complete len:51 (-) comp49584_c1_seq1:550-702(-)
MEDQAFWLSVGIVVGGVLALSSFAYFGYCLLRPASRRAHLINAKNFKSPH